jgi:hypothetical protein
MSRRFSASSVTASGISVGSLNFTIAGWVYHEVNNAGGGDILFLTNGAGNEIGIYTVGGSLFFHADGSSIFNQAISLNTWYHVAAVRNGTTQLAYIDGVQVHSSTAWAAATYNAFDCGSFGDTNTLQDLMVFDAELSVQEIQQLMRRRMPIAKRSNLYAWWPLFGDNATWDATGNGHTLSGSGDAIGVAQAPSSWGAQPGYAPRIASSGFNGTAAGLSNSTGAATPGVSSAASGLSQSTGAAAASFSKALTAAGLSNSTGAATAGLSQALAAAGLSNSSAAATAGLLQALTAAGLSQSTGSAVPGVSSAAAGLAQSTGAATAGLSKDLTAAGLSTSDGAATASSGGAFNGTAAGLSQSTGAATAALSIALTAAGLSTSDGVGTASSGGSFNGVAAGLSNSAGAAVAAQDVVIGSAGLSQSTGAAVAQLVYSLTAAGLSQSLGAAANNLATHADGLSVSTGVAVMVGGGSGVGVGARQAFAGRRMLVATGRRRLRG